jgi:hypothetical protein
MRVAAQNYSSYLANACIGHVRVTIAELQLTHNAQNGHIVVCVHMCLLIAEHPPTHTARLYDNLMRASSASFLLQERIMTLLYSTRR